MATPGKQPKAMSSRLATMKFMQRAGASPTSSPSTPSEPPSKKQRLSRSSYASASPATPQSESQRLPASGQRKLAETSNGGAADRGETKWYLSVKPSDAPAQVSPLQIVSAGYSTLDAGAARDRASDEDDMERARPSINGRRSFGKFNKVVEKQQKPDASSSSGSEDSTSEDEDEDDSDDPTGAKAMIAQARKEASDGLRAERKAKKRSETAEALRMADDRRKKEVNLNKVTSISNSNTSKPGSKDKACHHCGELGHLAFECPKKVRAREVRRNRER